MQKKKSRLLKTKNLTLISPLKPLKSYDNTKVNLTIISLLRISSALSTILICTGIHCFLKKRKTDMRHKDTLNAEKE